MASYRIFAHKTLQVSRVEAKEIIEKRCEKSSTSRLFYIISTLIFLLVSNSIFAQVETSTNKTSPLKVTSSEPNNSTNPKDERVLISTVAKLLEQGHYLKPQWFKIGQPNLINSDDEKINITERTLKNYLQLLDYNHIYFYESDIENFKELFNKHLSSDVYKGKSDECKYVTTTFKDRVKEKTAMALDSLKEKRDFTKDKYIEIDRKNAKWPANPEEAKKIISDRISAEILQEKLSGNKDPEETVKKRYEYFEKDALSEPWNDSLRRFLVSISQSYDPHSEYMSPTDTDAFNIQMKLSLVGIGAVLKTEDGYAKVIETIPGGPAEKDGRLKANDKIVAVSDEKGDMQDVVGKKIDKVVQKIRGEKGTKVKLEIIPSSSTDPSHHETIELVRDEVKLKESEARGEIIERNINGKKLKLGWIVLPSFYSEFDKTNKNAKSTTKDVAAIVERMKKEGIDGLVMDVRNNGGGSLEEAINLCGLFVGSGPVVQVKDSTGDVTVDSDDLGEPLYKGPLIVAINRLSASASEIFAAALQDYGRAIIAGDTRSFGKGTVQTILTINKYTPILNGSKDQGSLKMTIQKFYRVSGGSTQHRGVISDIKIPSLTDTQEIGEGALPNPLPYDEVEPQNINKFPWSHAITEYIKGKSEERVKGNRAFELIQTELNGFLNKRKENQLSLNENFRKKEIENQKNLKKEVEDEEKKYENKEDKTFVITLDSLKDDKLKTKDFNKKKIADEKKSDDISITANHEDIEEALKPNEKVDAVKEEIKNILVDLTTCWSNANTAKK
jgi:carboxyl-terminal processing protease